MVALIIYAIVDLVLMICVIFQGVDVELKPVAHVMDVMKQMVLRVIQTPSAARVTAKQAVAKLVLRSVSQVMIFVN